MSAYGLPLGRLYGPAWLHPDLWSPSHKNVWSAEKDASNHHCPDQECVGEIKTRCYQRLHVSFCICTIRMANGHDRFCGHRFQTESPKACALHGWGARDENRVFQRAKKGLSFELPVEFPHERKGWEMVLASAGCFQQPITIRMELVEERLCFVRVLSLLGDGRPGEITEVARVKTKELLLTDTDPRERFRACGDADSESSAEMAVRALFGSEQQDGEFDNPFAFKNHITVALDLAAAKKLEEKKTREARAANLAAQRAAAAKENKKCAKGSAVSYKQIIRCK